MVIETSLDDDAGFRAATARLAAMATFRDGDASRRQIGMQLGAREADFARCLAMSAWAIEKPLRMIVFALPMQASLDDCLVARLRDAGHPLRSLGDDAFVPCLDSRWEFVRGSETRPARYRPAPSYNDRLRVALLIDAWERATRRTGAIDAIEMLSRHLSQASATLAARLGVPAALLRRAAAERQLDVAAEEQLRRQIRRGMVGFADGDIRRLALTAALDGGADLAEAVQRHGTPAMRVMLRAHRDRYVPGSARADLEPRLARLRQAIWAPVSAYDYD
ncbi:MAG TPA: hypothetical protein VFV97_11470 [Rhodanobacteraceae bacterium]|nr:hypothetical protein [Rhodanobacteraceae bacterium]